VIPILPVLVSTIGLTPVQFSVVVASFAVSKLIGGIPSASWANVYGRRRILVAGTAICALGGNEVPCCLCCADLL
jgi:MFS family permease